MPDIAARYLLLGILISGFWSLITGLAVGYYFQENVVMFVFCIAAYVVVGIVIFYKIRQL